LCLGGGNIAAAPLGYLAYRSYEDSFDWKTVQITDGPVDGNNSRPAMAVDVGFVTPDGWQVAEIKQNQNGGWYIVYRKPKH
jgi:hypothetical protein